MDHQIRKERPAAFEHGWKKIRSQSRNRTDPDPALKRGAVPHFLRCIVDCKEDPAYPLEKNLAGFSGHCTPTKAVKQLVSKLSFQALNLLA
jgi:hypothetical protein